MNLLTEIHLRFHWKQTGFLGKARQLNMNTQTGGGSWPDYLARYRLYNKAGDLQKAIDGANRYLQQVYHNYSHTFFDSPGLRDKGAGFTTDYGYRIYDLFELFLETKDEKYLQAALTGARQFLLWTRSNPAPPAGNIVVNKDGKVDGIFPGRRTSALEGSVFELMDATSQVPEQEIPRMANLVKRISTRGTKYLCVRSCNAGASCRMAASTCTLWR